MKPSEQVRKLVALRDSLVMERQTALILQSQLNGILALAPRDNEMVTSYILGPIEQVVSEGGGTTIDTWIAEIDEQLVDNRLEIESVLLSLSSRDETPPDRDDT